MERRTRVLLTVLIALAGAVVALGLAVYPFQYGLGESLVVAGAIVAVGLFEVVLDDSGFGA